jgi:drug/metabolite transporter (DMT)-like permease
LINENSGWLFCFAFAILTATNTVYLGYLSEDIPTELMVLGSFLVVTVFFSLVSIINGGGSGRGALRRCGVKNVLVLNFATCLAWLGLFYSVRFIQPSLASMYLNGATPVIATVITLIMLGRGSVFINDWVVAIGLLSCMIYLGAASVENHSSVDGRLAKVVLGAFFAIIAGLGQVIVIFVSKKIMGLGGRPHEILQYRFFGIILFSLVLSLMNDLSLEGLVDNIFPITVVGLFLISLPLYLLQLGIKSTSAIKANVIISCIPLIVVFLELLDPSNDFSVQTFFGVSLGVALVLYGSLKKVKH